MRWTLFFLIVLMTLPASAGSGASGGPLDGQLALLRSAGDDATARGLEHDILASFRHSGSPSADLILTRATIADSTGDHDTALRLANTLVQLAPGFAEGWRLSATILREKGDRSGAMAALHKAVALNPRHFAALAELAELCAISGDGAAAQMYYRQVQVLDPRFSGIAERIAQVARLAHPSK